MNFFQLGLCYKVLSYFYCFRDEYDSVVRPMPAVKQRLTDANLLYHIVQLLLTYEPSIVQRVAILLLLVMQVCDALDSLLILYRTILSCHGCIYLVFSTLFLCTMDPMFCLLLVSSIIPIKNRLSDLLW